MSDDDYATKLARCKYLAARLLKDNEIKPRTKMAYKLTYATFYGFFDGKIPPGITLMLLAGRVEDLLDSDVMGTK